MRVATKLTESLTEGQEFTAALTKPVASQLFLYGIQEQDGKKTLFAITKALRPGGTWLLEIPWNVIEDTARRMAITHFGGQSGGFVSAFSRMSQLWDTVYQTWKNTF